MKRTLFVVFSGLLLAAIVIGPKASARLGLDLGLNLGTGSGGGSSTIFIFKNTGGIAFNDSAGIVFKDL